MPDYEGWTQERLERAADRTRTEPLEITEAMTKAQRASNAPTEPAEPPAKTPGLGSLRRRNADRIGALKRQGVELPPGLSSDIQMQALRQMLFGHGGPLEGKADMFTFQVETITSGLLDNIESQMNQAKLLAPLRQK